MEEMLIETPQDLGVLAKRVLEAVPKENTAGAAVLALHGELGAGKTAFTQALARQLGITETVPSPTFVIMKLYGIEHHPVFKTLVHIDAYRIGSAREAEVIGLPELFADPSNLMCIEWAGKIEAFIPKDAFHMEFAYAHVSGNGDLRKVVYGYKDTDA